MIIKHTGWILSLIWSHFIVNATEMTREETEFDNRGYMLFCLCMGNFGNKVDHFLGSLAFAKEIDRTFVIPPFRTYINIPFTEWFKLEPLQKYHRVIMAEEFMSDLAPDYWPVGNRTGVCFSYKSTDECKMKQGNPFQPFWDGLGVDFDNTETYTMSYKTPDKWKTRFPPSQYPVIALKGAPAPYPIAAENRHLQQYLQWSDSIVTKGQKYIADNFPGEKFIGIHLRNGRDWENACGKIDGTYTNFMSSPQCIPVNSGRSVTQEICLPSTQLILRQTKAAVEATGIRVVYVATDRFPLTSELKQHLSEYKVEVYHQDPELPQLDLYVLGQADHFIGNCVSSFTAFVARERTVNNKTTEFWGV